MLANQQVQMRGQIIAPMLLLVAVFSGQSLRAQIVFKGCGYSFGDEQYKKYNR